MKRKYPKLIDLIKENKLNEDPFASMSDSFADFNKAFEERDDKSNYLKTANDITPEFIKKTQAEAESKKQDELKKIKDGMSNTEKTKIRAKASQAESTHISSRGITNSKSGDYIVETQDGKFTEVAKNLVTVNESLSRGSLYRKRYYGRY